MGRGVNLPAVAPLYCRVDAAPDGSAAQPLSGADPGDQALEGLGQVLRPVLDDYPVVTYSVDGLHQIAHGMGQGRGCRHNSI